MKATETEVRLLLVDDHNVVRSGLRSLLEGIPQFKVAGETGDGQSALGLCEQLNPQIVLMDLRMPGVDGIQAISLIKQRFPGMKVIALTMHDSDEDVYHAIQSGAVAFVSKRASHEELISTIREVLTGHYRFPAWLTERMNRREAAAVLTESEIRLVNLIAEGKSNKDMAECLGVSEHKIKNELRMIFSKLGSLNRAEVVATAVARGFLKSKP